MSSGMGCLLALFVVQQTSSAIERLLGGLSLKGCSRRVLVRMQLVVLSR